jgi:anti-anti-sigma factor
MSVAERPLDDTAILHPEGSLRAPASSELRQEVDALLRTGRRHIVVNLARVPDIDAAGIGALVSAYNAATAVNGVLRITHAFGTTRELLGRVGVLDLLEDDAEFDRLRLGNLAGSRERTG